jgi:hypothetical protein
MRFALLTSALLLILALPSGLRAESRGRGFTLADGSRGQAEVAILVGGIHDTWRSLSAWVPVHSASGRRVLGYTYDQRRDDLEASARLFAKALVGLHGEGVRRVHITAYSMGGWVAKAALDRMAADGSISLFERVELTAVATPWGGFRRANLVWRLRAVPTAGLARLFSRLIGKPMGFEVGSCTPFVRARRAPLPPTVTFRVIEGGADEIANPRHPEERENYEAVVALASTRVLVPRARHRDMLNPDWRSR